jgi:hypothetical protein
MRGMSALAIVMRSAAVAAAILTLAIPAAAQAPLELLGPSQGTPRALVIGIDAYQHVRQLKGATADARDVVGALGKMGVKDVMPLIDAQVSRASVLANIDRLEQRTVAGDLIILAIAGHGAQEPERVKGSQPDGMDDVFLLPGFDPSSQTGATERIIGSEFNHIIKQFEARGAHVLFIADTCHGGGLARDVDPRAAEMSYREIPRYQLAVDDLKPISTTADAFLTKLDFTKSVFLAAVDRHTKAPEVHIPGIPGYRGALSYAVARAFEGSADANHDGKVTLSELFSNVRQVVYQLSDERQNIVTFSSPEHNIKRVVAFQITRGVHILDTVPGAAKTIEPTSTTQVTVSEAPSAAARPKLVERPRILPPAGLPQAEVSPLPTVKLLPVRIASLDGRDEHFDGLPHRKATFTVVASSARADLLWDPKSHDVIAGGDVIAYDIDRSDLPSVIDRMAAVQGFKQLANYSPQLIRTAPNDKRHHAKSRLEIEVSEVTDRSMVLFNIAGDGTVQALYPVGSDPAIIRSTKYSFPVEVRVPFGADQVIVVTSTHPLTALKQALRQLDQRRSAVEMLDMVQRLSPADVRIGTTGLFTAP